MNPYGLVRGLKQLYPDAESRTISPHTQSTLPTDGTQTTAASNADTIAKGVVRGDEQHAEATLSATVPTGMVASSKKAKVARGVNTLTDGGDVSLITPPSEACLEKRKVARAKAGKMDKSAGPSANAQAEVIFEMTIPGKCADTGAKKISSDLEEDSRVYSPTALTCNVFEGGSKRRRHSAPKGISEDAWADMSRQQHNDCRALHAEYVNRKAAMENSKAVQVNDGREEAVGSNIEATGCNDDEGSMPSAYAEVSKDVWDAMTKRQRKYWRQRNKRETHPGDAK